MIIFSEAASANASTNEQLDPRNRKKLFPNFHCDMVHLWFLYGSFMALIWFIYGSYKIHIRLIYCSYRIKGLAEGY